MANFYNPFQKGPDFAQGIEGIINQIMQMMMVKKLGQQTPTTSVGQTPTNPAALPSGNQPMQAGNRPMPPSVGAMMPPLNGQFGPTGTSGISQSGQPNQQAMMEQLMPLIMQMFGGGGMGRGF